MNGDDRESDKKLFLVKENSRKMISLDQIKSLFIADGMDAEEIAKHANLPVSKIESIISEHKLPELRKAYVIQGIRNIQNVQLSQSQKLMDLEGNFKRLRIIQLENQLKDFVAYYERYGDFYKRHPVSGDILRNTDGIPLQLKIPTISKEIIQLKESVTMSEGVKVLLNRLDEIINTGPRQEKISDDSFDSIIDAEYNEIFESSDD